MEEARSYYCVYIRNPYNYGSCQSPEFNSIDMCYQWLRGYLVEKGSRVEIQEVKTTPVSSDRYDFCDYDYGKDLGYSARDIASKLLWDQGCISKGYFERNKPKSPDSE